MTGNVQSTPGVSVVIPTFNSRGTIERTLESCLAQTVRPLEIILVDDASSDGTAGVADRYLSSQAAPRTVRYRIVRHATNEGPSKSRNDGWNVAEGEWIAFLDADDMWHPAKLEKILETVEAFPNVCLIAHTYDSAIVPTMESKSEWRAVAVGVPSVCRLRFLSLLLRNTVATPTVMVRRIVTERFREDMRYCEDHDLWLRIVARHEGLCFDLPLTRLGRAPLTAGGASSARGAMRLAEMRMYCRIAGVQPMFVVLLPFLIVWSLLKHLIVSASIAVKGTAPVVSSKGCQ